MELGERFTAAAASLTPQNETYRLQLVTQLEAVDFEADALQAELLRRRPGEISRGLSLYGPHRDDLRFFETATPTPDGPGSPPEIASLAVSVCGPVELPPGGRDLRLFGSQGEQRLAVLALLLAEQEVAASRTTEVGTLFLDDVMSELDDARRRLLVRTLSVAGQTIITTTNRQYFTDEELAEATLIELPLRGSVDAASLEAPAGSDGTAPPAMDAL
jgi:DNA replication and repair protein RecF